MFKLSDSKKEVNFAQSFKLSLSIETLAMNIDERLNLWWIFVCSRITIEKLSQKYNSLIEKERLSRNYNLITAAALYQQTVCISKLATIDGNEMFFYKKVIATIRQS